jgi:glycosyltransferase involved in cell wall biosynthesis
MSEIVSPLAAADSAERIAETDQNSSVASELRIALLTNMIPPFRRLLFLEMSRRCRHLRIFISTPTEAHRQWRVNWDGLDVRMQKTATLSRPAGHESSGDEREYVHFPIDTVPALARFKADATISSELGFRTVGAIICRLMNPRSRLLTWVCVSESTEAQRSKARGWFRKLLVRKIDGFLVNGESGARYLQCIGVPRGKIFRAPYPTDIERFGGSTLDRDEASTHRMLYVGQFVTRKGLVPFLRVLVRWATDHPSKIIEIYLVGSGPLEQTLKSLPRPSNLTVSVHGFVPYDDLATVYQSAGIFVFPTLADEWGTVVSEAMASGLPVLGSVEGQAVEELVRDGVSGWLFRRDKEHEIYDAIDRSMKTSPEQLSRMRIEARNAALRISPQAVAEQVLAAVQACLAR